MSFRTVVIQNRCKLDLKMNYLVCRGEEEQKVFIPEISVLILASTAIALTSALVSALIKNNVKIIFCDEKHNPESELMPYAGSYNSSKRILQQIAWTSSIKGEVWQKIVQYKIEKQRDLLAALSLYEQADLLSSYIPQVQVADSSNREGHAAKVYFNALFGMAFTRRNSSFINSALNYGYAIVLSSFTREIVKNGYLTQLGIWHHGETNPFNLASDFMEPFRIVVDSIVLDLPEEEDTFKSKIVQQIFNRQLTIDGKKQYFENAVTVYCQNIFKALEQQDSSFVSCYE